MLYEKIVNVLILNSFEHLDRDGLLFLAVYLFWQQLLLLNLFHSFKIELSVPLLILFLFFNIIVKFGQQRTNVIFVIFCFLYQILNSEVGRKMGFGNRLWLYGCNLFFKLKFNSSQPSFKRSAAILIETHMLTLTVLKSV